MICSECMKEIHGEGLALKSGVYVCPDCFQRRLAGPAAAAPSASAGFNPLQHINLLIGLGIVGAIAVGGYLIYSKQAEARTAEAKAVIEQQKLESERSNRRIQEYQEKADAERRASAERAEQQRKEQELAKQQAAAVMKAEAEKRAIKEAARDEQRRKEQAEKQKADEEAAAQKEREREAQELAEKQRVRVQETAAVKEAIQEGNKEVRDAAAEMMKQYNTLTKEVRAAEAAVEEDKRRYAALKTRYETARKIMDENGYNRVVGSHSQSDSGAVSQVDADQLQRNANYRKQRQEAIGVLKEYDKLCEVVKQHEDDLALKREKLEAAKKWLAEYDAAEKKIKGHIVATADTLLAPPTDQAGRIRGMKTLFKKDGSSIQIQSSITADDTLRYKDAKGNWGEIKTKDVDRVENNDDAAGKPVPVEPGKKNGKTIDF